MQYAIIPRISAGLLACLLLSTAQATGNPYNLKPLNPALQQEVTPRNYVGVSLGQADADEASTAWKVYIGVRLSDQIMLEGGYSSLGEMQSQNTQGDTANNEIRGYSAAAMLRLPAMENISAFGKAGAFFWENEVNAPTGTHQDEGTATLLGIGAHYDLGDNVGIRAEWERFGDVGSVNAGKKTDVNLLSVGLSFSSL